MNRRNFLATTAALALPAGHEATAAPASIPIIDCHIHLFDVSRPQGVPWPPKDDKVLYKTASMERYRQIAPPLGIVGAIEVEASPLFDDNQWVLDIAAKDKMIVGTVGDLEPDKPDFRAQLDRFHKNPLFRGIRYGNIWDRDLAAMVDKPEFIAGMKMLADAGLAMDSANPDPRLINGILRLTDKVPTLRVVIDHLPRLVKPKDAAALKAYEGDLSELGKRKQVFVKVSGVVRRVNGNIQEDPAFYKSGIDELYAIFGEDRLIYGSDWPNSDQWAEYPVELKIVRAYFMAKGQAIAEKYFWKNSLAAYRWIHRESAQPKS
ncbi:MAG: amidohydrolase family protein [Acidobacteriota bacterium]|nr:amidohydrolase family protein [Acidobacteriota bacterium]